MPGADQLYTEAIALCGPALRRLAMGYERDPEGRRDLLQDMHLELWRSFRQFEGRCSIKIWLYRVVNNVGVSHLSHQRRVAARLVDLNSLDVEVASIDGQARADHQFAVATLLDRIHRLKPVDRLVMLLYLEDESAESIAETAGSTASNVAVKIHRIKKLLAR